MVDPAGGTCGFPINTILHVRKRYTTPETVKLEWDGTPHHVDGDRLTAEDEQFFTGRYFTAYDNDRTMVRIGWMNLVLHGIEAPRVVRQDTLGKSLLSEESRRYSYALANPPYTGTVDKDDLHPTRFRRDPRKNTEPISTKSELLFVWLLLDLLEEGGRGAVIVPEGLLFGSTNAHVALRRELLFQHRLEGVISLPAGVFQPYTGVKTSILVFQKYAELPADNGPRTQNVWFYEVEADGYTLDAKRNEKPEPNDLWDALEKWRLGKLADDTSYYQPRISEERWRHVDDDTLKLFPDLGSEQDQRSGIHELFPELSQNPTEADRQVSATQAVEIADLYAGFLLGSRQRAQKALEKQTDDAKRRKAITDILTGRLRTVSRWLDKAAKENLDSEFEQHGRKAMVPLRERVESLARRLADELVAAWAQGVEYPIQAGMFADDEDPPVAFRGDVSPLDDETEGERRAREIILEFAKLDGFDVKLRSQEVYPQPEPLAALKNWAAPVRVLAQREDWESKDAEDQVILRGSHDEAGQVRPKYLDYLRSELSIFDVEGMVKREFMDRLTPDCIEANGLNLSAGRYKPISIARIQHDPPATIIRDLQDIETRIQDGLANVLALVEKSL
jgi:type I restriction enzyme M protein